MKGGISVKKLLRFFISRLFWFSLLIVVQIAILVVILLNLSSYSNYIYAAFVLLSLAIVIWLVAKDDNPSYKITWIILIMTLPVLGGFFYLKFGNKTIPSRYREKSEAHRRSHAALYTEEAGDTAALMEAYPKFSVQTDYIRRISGYPAYTGTQVEYAPLGEDFFRMLCEELPRAQKFIFLEYFIIEKGLMWDTILKLLKERAAAGVEVCLIYDDFGCIRRLSASYPRELAAYNIKAIPFNPLRPSMDPSLNYRDHRKICVIDGRIAFTGGANFADEYINEVERFGHWKDCGILVRGKAVWSMTVMFLSLWGYVDRSEEDVGRFRVDYPEKQGNTGFLQPFADSPLDNEDVGATILQSVISSAQERMWIMTPYLILDDKMTTALCVAAKTGVDVRIITPGIPDKWYVHAVTRANYEELTRAGVRIFEYTPGFIHSKVYLADTKQAVVGTVNLDFRSLYLHFEDAVYLYDTTVNAQVQADFEETFPQCKEITAEQCYHTRLTQRVLRALLRLLAPLM